MKGGVCVPRIGGIRWNELLVYKEEDMKVGRSLAGGFAIVNGELDSHRDSPDCIYIHLARGECPK